MKLIIRRAIPIDFPILEHILKENNMLSSPETDGIKAMQRVYDFMPRYFLVAEQGSEIVGMIRGCYDGSRAIIHEVAVAPQYQKQGIGKKLVQSLASRFKQDGAQTIGATSTEGAKTYYEKLSFTSLPVTLMVGFDIDKVIERCK